MNTAKEKATKIVNEAIKDHDDGGYAYVSMNEILITKITQALEQASRTPIKWPTEKEIEEASFVSDMASMHEVMAFRLGVQWLKSFIEKGE